MPHLYNSTHIKRIWKHRILCDQVYCFTKSSLWMWSFARRKYITHDKITDFLLVFKQFHWSMIVLYLPKFICVEIFSFGIQGFVFVFCCIFWTLLSLTAIFLIPTTFFNNHYTRIIWPHNPKFLLLFTTGCICNFFWLCTVLKIMVSKRCQIWWLQFLFQNLSHFSRRSAKINIVSPFSPSTCIYYPRTNHVGYRSISHFKNF
jgi:hypothetical protein